MALSSSKRIVLVLAIIGSVLLWNYHRAPDLPPAGKMPEMPVPQAPAVSSLEDSPPASLPETRVQPPVSTPPIAAAPPGATPSPVTPPSPAARVLPGSVAETPAGAGSVDEDLNAVDATIRSFQTVLGENPVGSNAEITGALLGNNLKQIKLEVPAGSHLNGEGELCDRWGTPYFLHQLSKTEMEIRSAGPDRQMWTGDDSQR